MVESVAESVRFPALSLLFPSFSLCLPQAHNLSLLFRRSSLSGLTI